MAADDDDDIPILTQALTFLKLDDALDELNEVILDTMENLADLDIEDDPIEHDEEGAEPAQPKAGKRVLDKHDTIRHARLTMDLEQLQDRRKRMLKFIEDLFGFTVLVN